MIDENIKQFVEKQKLGYVATISPDNTPNLSPKGTIIVYNKTTLAFADIRSPNTIRNISSNPNVEINVVDPILRRGFRFSGTAKIIKEGDTFKAILTRYKSIGIKNIINTIVLINVSNMSEITSPLYDLGFSEEEIKTRWCRYMLDT